MSAAPHDAPHLPEIVLQKADRDGDGGRAWASALPGVLRELSERWALVLGEALPGASESHVVRARNAEGGDVVLKVCVPSDDFAARAAVLHLADGDGAVRLLRVDHQRQAMLLEALGPDLAAEGRDPLTALTVVGRLLRRSWRMPPPGPLGPPTGKAASLGVLVSDLAAALPGAAPAGVVEAALQCARRRSDAFDPASSRLLHGDAAPANVLRVLVPRPGAPDGYVLCDPQPFVGDPAYDLGVAARDWVAPLRVAADPAAALRIWCSALADGAGAGADEVWEWAFLERVSTGLCASRYGASDVGAALLETAGWLLGRPGEHQRSRPPSGPVR